MAFITLDEAKNYLRVDSSDEDAYICVLIDSAFSLCADIARLDEGQREILLAGEEIKNTSEVMRIAVLYSIGYLFEHREQADHHELTMTLRSILFAIREGVY